MCVVNRLNTNKEFTIVVLTQVRRQYSTSKNIFIQKCLQELLKLLLAGPYIFSVS